MNIQNKDGNIMKYSVKFEPEIADNANKIQGQIIKGCREQLSKKFTFYIPFQKNIFSHQLVADEVVCKSTVDDVEYTVTVNFSKNIDDNDMEKFMFFNIFFKNIMRNMKFE